MIGLEDIGLALTVTAYAAGVAVALRAAEATDTAQGGVAWAVALVAMPWIALPAYALFGPPKLGPLADGLAEARAAAEARRAARDDERPVAAEADTTALRAPLERLAPRPAVAAPPPRLLVDGTETFAGIFAAIDAAESYILVQFYIVRDDEIGRALAARLAARAREGLRVLFLYDEVGARNAPARYWADLEAAGVEVLAFGLSRRRPRVMRLNFRNHRKMVVADGRVAILGGANVGDEYLGRDPAFGPWRDTAIRLEGAAAARLEASFVEDWLWTGGAAPPPPPPPGARGETPVLILPTGPADAAPTCSLAFLHLITAARRRLWIASPYFAPDLDTLQGLKVAALRGVDVRVLIPDRPDHRIVWLAAYAYAEEAFASGIRLHRYEAGFMHQKALVVDDGVAAVGTANLDNRSFRLNFELTALVFDAAFAASVAAMLERDFARSRPHDAAFHATRGAAVRVLAPAARLFAPLL